LFNATRELAASYAMLGWKLALVEGTYA
jgi:hypothetical protein